MGVVYFARTATSHAYVCTPLRAAHVPSTGRYPPPYDHEVKWGRPTAGYKSRLASRVDTSPVPSFPRDSGLSPTLFLPPPRSRVFTGASYRFHGAGFSPLCSQGFHRRFLPLPRSRVFTGASYRVHGAGFSPLCSQGFYRRFLPLPRSRVSTAL